LLAPWPKMTSSEPSSRDIPVRLVRLVKRVRLVNLVLKASQA